MKECQYAFYSEISWYELIPKQRRLLLPLLSQRFIIIKAIFYPMTYEILQRILKSAFSHWLIVKDVIEKKY